MMIRRLALAALAVGLGGCATLPDRSPAAAPDSVYFNAQVWRGGSRADDASFSQAFATRDGRIVAVGDSRAILSQAGRETKRYDLGGKFVVPGFIDNHTHFLSSSLAMDGVDLRDAATPDEFSRRISDRARRFPGEWIVMGNWDEQLWGGALPHRDWIDPATPRTPVFVTRLDGHVGLANQAALRLANIDADTPNPVGGHIGRDAAGHPTGILKDTAMALVTDHIPKPDPERVDEALARGFAHALRNGVTQIHDMGDENWDALLAFRGFQSRHALPIRVYSFVPLADWADMRDYVAKHGRGDAYLRWGGVKGFVDGSLGASTAWFHAPYTDDPANTGLQMLDMEALGKQIEGADRANLHVAVHAIGDRANDWLLERLETIHASDPGRDRRFRVEHAQHLSASAFARFGAIKAIASVQPYHAIDDGRWAETKIGADRLPGAYAFRSLIAHGATVSFGSDWNVAPISPLWGIAAAVERRTLDGKHPEGWVAAEKVTVLDALHAYTAANAHAGFQERFLGRLEPGMAADFALLSENLFAIDSARIRDVSVVMTVVAGQIKYCAERCVPIANAHGVPSRRTAGR